VILTEIKTVKTKDIKFAPYNPRRISDEVLNKLKRSIEEFGYVEPIIVNKRTMHVVGGNQRLKVLKQLGIEETEAVMVDLPLEKEKALNVALNKITGDWDYDLLKDLLRSIEDYPELEELTGFSDAELNILLKDYESDYEEDTIQNYDYNEEEPTEKDDGISYVVYLSFPTKERAEEWLKDNGFENKFKPNSRTLVVRIN